jgi:hypothetical protein
MGNYSATAALLTAFDMQLDTEEPPLLPQQGYAARLFAPGRRSRDLVPQ